MGKEQGEGKSGEEWSRGGRRGKGQRKHQGLSSHYPTWKNILQNEFIWCRRTHPGEEYTWAVTMSLACSITACWPLQDTEKTSWSSVGLNLEGSESREARLSSLGTALCRDHREAGVPREKLKVPSESES